MSQYATGEPKSKMRGVFHAILAMTIPIFSYYLITHARPDARMACTIYITAIFISYAVSALYHRGTWQLETETALRRVDHAAIYSNITGSYVPAALLLLGGAPKIAMLSLAAVITTIGWGYCATKNMENAEGGPGLALYALAAGCILPFMGFIYPQLSTAAFACTIATWAQIALAAIVYSRRWPDPWPETFGYHEIFHILISGAAVTTAYTVWSITG